MAEVRAITPKTLWTHLPSREIISSVSPSLQRSCSGLPEGFQKAIREHDCAGWWLRGANAGAL